MKVFITLISLAAVLACTLNLQGCALHVSTNWVDTHEEQTKQVSKPVYCRFFNCEANKQ